jgi:hypothetical protein
MSKSLARKLHDRTLKLMKWTCRAEDALTRKQALKALRKIAKHSRKLAQLQGRSYIEGTQEEQQ